MKGKDNIPEIFSCIRKAFEYVKSEVIEDEMDMDCLNVYLEGCG